MAGFTPFKRHANQFKYIPRYYDPQKEAMEQRRAELRGERLDDSDQEYKPGQYIRRKSAARMDRKRQSSSRRILVSIGVIVVVAYLGSLLYAKIIDMFGLTDGVRSESVITPNSEFEEFDPYAPIVIVPNDYEE